MLQDMLAIADKVMTGAPNLSPVLVEEADDGFTYLVVNGTALPNFNESFLSHTLFKSYGDRSIYVFFRYTE